VFGGDLFLVGSLGLGDREGCGFIPVRTKFCPGMTVVVVNGGRGFVRV
jgi:hypothetical protein